VDVGIAQGTESAAHTGELSRLVLWPQVVAAVAPTRVLAAGGVAAGGQMLAALALGAQRVWTGSIWLTVKEASTPMEQKESLLTAGSRDTIRSKSVTGKPARMLKNDWTDAWEDPNNPDPLPMPMQGLVSMEMVMRTSMYAEKSQAVAFNPVGQIVGSMNQVLPTRVVMDRLVDEYIDSVDRMHEQLPGD